MKHSIGLLAVFVWIASAAPAAQPKPLFSFQATPGSICTIT
jgi:hypothetical protein